MDKSVEVAICDENSVLGVVDSMIPNWGILPQVGANRAIKHIRPTLEKLPCVATERTINSHKGCPAQVCSCHEIER